LFSSLIIGIASCLTLAAILRMLMYLGIYLWHIILHASEKKQPGGCNKTVLEFEHVISVLIFCKVFG